MINQRSCIDYFPLRQKHVHMLNMIVLLSFASR
jgi:hypothetical protein